jgi:hypothetical protein
MDPGHAHSLNKGSGGSTKLAWGGYKGSKTVNFVGSLNKTGISVENLPAQSGVSISIDANDAGEHLPMVYVLICQVV